MIKILKYQHSGELETEEAITVPSIANIVHVAMQHGKVTFWAVVETESEPIVRRFMIAGTGWELPAGVKYIGTAYDGPFVWHLMELVD